MCIRRCLALSLIAMLLAACGGGGGGGGSSDPATAVSEAAPPATSNANTPSDNPAPAPAAATEIKLLALYTDGVAEQFTAPDLRIQHLVNVANDVVTQSGVELRFVLAHIEWVDYPDNVPPPQALDDVTFAAHSALAGVPGLRDQVDADLVVLVKPYANDGLCGYAWIGGYQMAGDFGNPAEADYGYSVVASNCSDYNLIHELGHNLGLAHSRRESPDGGTFNYALGHGMDHDFVTIMASPDEYAAPRLPKLSSPTLTCNAQPCGVPADNIQAGADAVRALNVSKDQVAAYR